eukprot:scaffold3753_cov411-Chaetoceros_neogracile.AAC.4
MNQREEQLKALSKIDETCRKLQDDGFDQEAFDCLQLGLSKRQDLFGPKSNEFDLECKRVGQVFNDIALRNMNNSNFDKALEYLKHALKIVPKDDKSGKLLILQNVAESHRKTGKLKNLVTATKYLRHVIKMQIELNSLPDELARSNLNACANLSLLGKHEAALRHAEIAIGILRHEIHDSACQRNETGKACDRESSLEMQVGSEDDSDSYSLESDDFANADSKYIETLAVAYYNTGVEHEHLGDIKKCYHFYQQGIIVAHSLGCHHAIGKVLKESSQAVIHKIVRESKE